MLDELCTKPIFNNITVHSRSVSDIFYINLIA